MSAAPLKLEEGQVASIVGWSGEMGHLRVLNKLAPNLDLESSVVARVAIDNPEMSFALVGPGLIYHQPTGVSWLTTAFSAGLGVGCGGVRDGVGGCERGAGGLSLGVDLAVGELWDCIFTQRIDSSSVSLKMSRRHFGDCTHWASSGTLGMAGWSRWKLTLGGT